MLEVLVIGDPHFKKGNSQDTDHLFNFTKKLLEEKTYDAVVVLGDVLDEFENYNEGPYNRAYSYLYMISVIMKHKLIVLVGNHDIPGPNDFLSKQHPFAPLRKCVYKTASGEEVTPWVVDDVTEIVLTDKEGTSYPVIATPYVPTGRFLEALHLAYSRPDPLKKPFNEYRAVFAHQDLYGCKMNPDSLESTHGDRWPSKFDTGASPPIISGHIHTYQVIGDNIWYPGSPIQHSISENTDKSVSVFTFQPSREKPPTEQRIYVGGRVRTTYRFKAAEINDIKFLENEIPRFFIIVSSEAERKQIMSHPLVILWKSKGWKVETENTSIPTVQLVNGVLVTSFKGNTCFYDRVMKQVEADPEGPYMKQLAEYYLRLRQ